MKFIESLIRNHPLANILFAVVLIGGFLSYNTMPREQDPEINFNWVNITTILPGASAEDIERLVTNPLEDAIKGVADVRFIISSSRESASNILVRFREIPERLFDKRINDLRREIQNKAKTELPTQTKDPIIAEITTSNGFPTAILVLRGQADDETMRANARAIKADLERLAGVDAVIASGLRLPELQVRFDPQRLAARGLTPPDVADAVTTWFRDTAAGSVRAGDEAWIVRIEGQTTDPDRMAKIPVTGLAGNTALLEEIGAIERARAKASTLAGQEGRPAITLAVTKKTRANTIELVDRLNGYIKAKNPIIAASGLELVLGDDQTVPTREAIKVMEANALQGLVMVLLVCWLFLGFKIAVLVSLGIPFALAGTFATLNAMGFTLNVSVLLAVVIALGMLVDDAVVVVEAIYYRIQRGEETFSAAVGGVREVWAPVLSSVATTLAAFLPLMLLPGILGKFMFIIPFVVTLALVISLVEAFWMLPAHVTVSRLKANETSRGQRWRNEFNRKIRLRYGQWLVKAIRHPIASLAFVVVLVAGAAGAFMSELVRVQFFAFDALRIFYVNVDMPPSATIEDTLAATQRVEAVVRTQMKPGEMRNISSVAGVKFTETEPLFGDAYGQVIVSLLPRETDGREVGDVVEQMRTTIESLPGPGRKSFLRISGGPPTAKPINVKVRGDDPVQLRAAADAIAGIARGIDGARDVGDDDLPGRRELTLVLDRDAIRAAGINAAVVTRAVRLFVDGEVVSILRASGDKIEVRVQAKDVKRDDIAAVLEAPIALPKGGSTTLGALVRADTRLSKGVIKHYNLRRTITVEGDLDKARTDTVKANNILKAEWEKLRAQYPSIDLEFGGELEDIQESLDAMVSLFALGIGLIYLILAAQFRSYFQPFLILSTVPLAFAGVTLGLVVSRNPLSLFTLYGVIALTGIAVNSAIVLIDAMNERRARGMGLAHAIVQAARRRIVPVIITSATTVAGLMSLALGIGGKSLLWGPVASSIVWGLGVATILTLFVVPLLYGLFMRRWRRSARTA